MHIGASTVLLEKAGPPDLLEAIAAHRATVCFTAPTSYRAMAAGAREKKLGVRDGGTLRKCVAAGEALPAATRALWKESTGIEIIDGIGATEMFHIFIAADEASARPGATGKAVPGYRARVVDDDGRDVPAGTIGRLAVQGPTGCRYLSDPRQADYVKGGWNYTGDAYLQDADGYFFYQSRTDDMIISAGYNIAAIEVEDVLLRHEAVAECAVIGHARRGARPDRQGVRRAARAALGRRGDGEGAAGFREGDGGAVQVPAGGGVPGGVAADGDGEAAEIQVTDELDSLGGFQPGATKPHTAQGERRRVASRHERMLRCGHIRARRPSRPPSADTPASWAPPLGNGTGVFSQQAEGARKWLDGSNSARAPMISSASY